MMSALLSIAIGPAAIGGTWVFLPSLQYVSMDDQLPNTIVTPTGSRSA